MTKRLGYKASKGGVAHSVGSYATMTELVKAKSLVLRQWIREVNQLGLPYGHEDMAGTPDDPEGEYVDRFEAGETPAYVIGWPQPTSSAFSCGVSRTW